MPTHYLDRCITRNTIYSCNISGELRIAVVQTTGNFPGWASEQRVVLTVARSVGALEGGPRVWEAWGLSSRVGGMRMVFTCGRHESGPHVWEAWEWSSRVGGMRVSSRVGGMRVVTSVEDLEKSSTDTRRWRATCRALGDRRVRVKWGLYRAVWKFRIWYRDILLSGDILSPQHNWLCRYLAAEFDIFLSKIAEFKALNSDLSFYQKWFFHTGVHDTDMRHFQYKNEMPTMWRYGFPNDRKAAHGAIT